MSDQVRHDDGCRMKQINVFPMLIMLIVVLVIIAWFGGYLT
jgi:hypothetical protein